MRREGSNDGRVEPFIVAVLSMALFVLAVYFWCASALEKIVEAKLATRQADS